MPSPGFMGNCLIKALEEDREKGEGTQHILATINSSINIQSSKTHCGLTQNLKI